MLSALLHSTIIRWVGGFISLATGALVIYSRWNKTGVQKINIKKTQVDILESMLQLIEKMMLARIF
ncbi:MAG: hypothetical protein M0Z50_17010 [Planctomycetia bacterium]|nr:hypothetical protein [Planctomycetia bacterium]